ncbi:MAG: HNH endonuclease signature motif containing protein [Minisyncoccia bacterium]
MTRQKKWGDENLIAAVKDSLSVRQVIKKLGLIEAGGNYVQIQQRIKALNIDISHFTGKGWNKGGVFRPIPLQELSSLLINGSLVQSHKLKKRLFREGLKKPQCELCNWSKESLDGRIPVELDHINGNRFDNRIENLRILCPNCHSLQPTHRGKNKKKV